MHWLQNDDGFCCEHRCGTSGHCETKLQLPLVCLFFEKGSLAAWRKQFDGYCYLLDLDNAAKLRLYSLCFHSSRFDSIWETVDDLTTIESLFQRLSDHIKHEDRLADPLWHFVSRTWNTDETIYDYVRDLKMRALYIITNAAAVTDLVKLQILRGLPRPLRAFCGFVVRSDELISSTCYSVA